MDCIMPGFPVLHYLLDFDQTHVHRISDAILLGEGNDTPLQYSCLENPRDRGAWWAAIYGVAQSWTRLKRLSSSSSSSYPTILSSVAPFSSCPQSFPASKYFPVGQLFSSGGQSIGASASVSVLPMSIQG